MPGEGSLAASMSDCRWDFAKADRFTDIFSLPLTKQINIQLIVQIQESIHEAVQQPICYCVFQKPLLSVFLPDEQAYLLI
jgi:hypothetical protein